MTFDDDFLRIFDEPGRAINPKVKAADNQED